MKTGVTINAPPQTVWSILDNLEKYPEWNSLVPQLRGKTTVGSVVTGKLVQPNMPEIPLSPTLTRIVGARELRWITIVPGEQGFSAEHYFLLQPSEGGGTDLVHNENFDGPAVPHLWPAVEANGTPAYRQMNLELKARAEARVNVPVRLHPSVDAGVASVNTVADRITLKCRCQERQVEVLLTVNWSHNHLCGCSKCWKPMGALFAQIAVVPRNALTVSHNDDKLQVVDPGQAIQRHACRECGVHMLGRVEDPDHHFFGIDFIHPELAIDQPCAAPEFAGFVSSIIGSGADPSIMQAVRNRLRGLGIPAYDVFSPELMDIIEWHKIKLATYPATGDGGTQSSFAASPTKNGES